MSDGVVVAVLGAGDLAGEEILRLLAASPLAIASVRALDSGAAVGQPADYGDDALVIEDPVAVDFSTVQLVLACCDQATAERYLPAALAAHCTIVDSSGYAETQAGVPLVASLHNLQVLENARPGAMIATPSYAALQLLQVLAPLQAEFGLTRAALTVCHPAAQGGRGAVESLARHSAAALNGQGVHTHPGTRPFALVPALHTGSGFAITDHLHRLLGDPGLKLAVAEMLVPVFFECTAVIHAETTEEASREALETLYAQHGLQLPGTVDPAHAPQADDAESGIVLPHIQWLKCEADPAGEGSVVSLCVSADAVRWGVAANHVQIAARLIEALSG
ncbi:MAG: hypothetical protein EPN72_03380 [Nevskiaceae bacterium]|nr:MAG: hypothetical protein EPN63_06160 [Nevskiaceae bacterium]TBR73874.1 MAG: hypothetical protein EPN72_03380 [Nevskiaceae bacterium]